MFENRTVAVVVPAWNEADKVAEVLRTMPALVDRVIVVDDGSSDDTAEVARACAGGADAQVEIITHPSNRGVGAAIATGYTRAFAAGADLVAVMAGDAQMDPGDLPDLLRAVVHGGADYAKGNRLVRWAAEPAGAAGVDPAVRRTRPARWAALREMPWSRWAGNLVLSFFTRVATTGWRGSDAQCGYTVANRRALAAISAMPLFARYGYPNALIVQLDRAGLRLVDVPVRAVYGKKWRSSLRPWRVALPIVRLLSRAWVARVTSVPMAPRPDVNHLEVLDGVVDGIKG